MLYYQSLHYKIVRLDVHRVLRNVCQPSHSYAPAHFERDGLRYVVQCHSLSELSLLRQDSPPARAVYIHPPVDGCFLFWEERCYFYIRAVFLEKHLPAVYHLCSLTDGLPLLLEDISL